MAISAACNNANSVKIANQMVSLEANSFVVRGTIGASGLRATIPPPAWAGRRKERKGSLDARRRVRKADRMPFVLRSGRSEDDTCCCCMLVVVSNEREVEVAVEENLERMD